MSGQLGGTDFTELTALAADDRSFINDTSDTTESALGTTKYFTPKTMAAYAGTETVTPNTDSGAASTIDDFSIAVTIAAVTVDANDWIVLPTIANVPIGRPIVIVNNAGSNLEMRTIAASNVQINGVDSDGTNEYLVTDGDTVIVWKKSATEWIAQSITSAGAVRAAVVPD